MGRDIIIMLIIKHEYKSCKEYRYHNIIIYYDTTYRE